MGRRPRNHRRHGSLLLSILLLAACGTGDPGNGPPVLRVGHVGHDHQLALYVAALEGETFVAEYGVGLRPVKRREVYDLVADGSVLARLHLIKTGGGAKAPAAMERGEIDIGLGGTMPVARFVDQGAPLRIVAPLQADGDMLVVRADLPIRSWSEFTAAARAAERPLKIGYKSPLAGALLVFEGALLAEGIPFTKDATGMAEAKVLLVNFGSEKGPLPLLEAGELDGLVMNQPVPAVIVHRKLGRVVADLRDLPPAGRWHDHPCCCVFATEQIIAERDEALTALLRAIARATDLIIAEPDRAVGHAVEWIGNPREIEAVSIPTVRYTRRADAVWRRGMVTWAEQLGERGVFTGKLENLVGDAFIDRLCDLRAHRAATGVPAAGKTR